MLTNQFCDLKIRASLGGGRGIVVCWLSWQRAGSRPRNGFSAGRLPEVPGRRFRGPFLPSPSEWAGRSNVIFDVAETVHVATCDYPDFVFRREGLDSRGYLHIRAMRAVGLLDKY